MLSTNPLPTGSAAPTKTFATVVVRERNANVAGVACVMTTKHFAPINSDAYERILDVSADAQRTSINTVRPQSHPNSWRAVEKAESHRRLSSFSPTPINT